MGKKRILICGATGFIGRNMAEHFSHQGKYLVTGTYFKSEPYDHPNLDWVKADLTNAETVAEITKDVDILIQAAATTSGSKDIVNTPYIHVTDNAMMNSLIFRSAFTNSVSNLIFFSCTIMYQSNETPLKETDFDANQELIPNYFGAGWTKIYAEKMSEFYSRLGRTKYTVLRHSNIFGPYDKYNLEQSHVFGATVTKIMATEQEHITVWGIGEEERDLLYISDLVNAVDLALTKQEYDFRLYNIGAGSSIAVKDLVTKIIDASGRNLSIKYDTTKPTIKTKLCLDCGLALEELGWQPKTSLEEGIVKTLEWYKANVMVPPNQQVPSTEKDVV